ncbi:hypothetical protein VRC24_17215 [Pseudomonas poae]|uniref:hypothetical protein n=1 Tax=Pseudomonas poae TaxID=200451 RepID=UPI0030D4B65C
MSQNQTIDGVPRKLLTSLLAWLERANERNGDGDIAEYVELRALLDADKVNNRQMGLVQFVEAHPIKPAARPQGEPVAWANWKVGSKSYVPYRTVGEARRCVEASEISATQNGPYRVVPLYAEQPAPVAVPERLVMTDGLHTYEHVTGHNAAIDKMLGVKS